MLTYPSDSLPQIVCPMDEDAIPSNPLCSAPPHSEPAPPLLPLSSITPRCTKDGISGHRRSGRIQGFRTQTAQKQSNTESTAAQKPSKSNPSPTERQRDNEGMVSQSKQLRIEITHVHEKQNEDGFDVSYTAECQNTQKDQNNPNVSENVAEQFTETTTQRFDITKSDVDTCQGLAVGQTAEDASPPKGWMIGPLFRSFRSKMACFREIVMSPVKHLIANSPPPDHPDNLNELMGDGTSDDEHSEPSSLFHPKGQSQNRNQEVEDDQSLTDVEVAQNTRTVDVKCSQKLSFDVEITHNHTDSVPSQQSSLPCNVFEKFSESIGSDIRPPVCLSASHESSAGGDQKNKQTAQLKPLTTKRPGNRSKFKKVTSKFKKATSKTPTSEVRKEECDLEVSDEQLSHRNSLKSSSSSSDADKTLSLSSASYIQPDTDCLQPNGKDGGNNTESCCLVRQSLRNTLNDRANERTLKPTTDTRQLEYSARGLVKAKKGVKLHSRAQDLAKRKRLIGDICAEDTKKQELLNVASDSGTSGRLRSPKKEGMLTDKIVDRVETLKPTRKRQVVSTRTNRKGKDGQAVLPTPNEAALKTQTESSPDAVLICSVDKGSSKTMPRGSCKRLKMTTAALVKLDIDINIGMHLETSAAVSSIKEAKQDTLTGGLDVKQPLDTRKCRNINKKPLKRKSSIQSSVKESDSTLVFTSSKLQPLKLCPTGFSTSPPAQGEEQNLKTRLNPPYKKPKKGLKGAVKSSESGDAQEIKQRITNLHTITKENHTKDGKGNVSMDLVYFKTPFESSQKSVFSLSQPHLDSYLFSNNKVKDVMDEKEKRTSLAVEVFPTDTEASNHSSISVSKPRSTARRLNVKLRRVDDQRRRCIVLNKKTCKGEEETNSMTIDDTHLATEGTCLSENGFSRRLLRSFSCPEIPSCHPLDSLWTTSLPPAHHSKSHTSHQHQHQTSHTPLVHHKHKSLQRARRHTVCSVEVEREIAPLCLRKEVYPSRRSVPYDVFTYDLSPSHTLSPSTSLSALASCFLSSPLAFLSKKVESRGCAVSPNTYNHASSPTSSSSTSPLSSSTWHLPRNDMASISSADPLECEIKKRQQSEEDDDGENTSSSSQEYEESLLREEKALSDSEIKVVQKHEERGKVSSIRIRKTLPKPQNNLTPMGLPKPIRLKKKEFSLEEIYTNKNFNKPPESRLETIFEVPFNRRNGSESLFGQRRVKRFLEFLEVGKARKPKKPLVGVGKGGNSSSRTRRGNFTKDEPPLTSQDVDSLLCAKLDELNLWLIHDQNNS